MRLHLRPARRWLVKTIVHIVYQIKHLHQLPVGRVGGTRHQQNLMIIIIVKGLVKVPLFSTHPSMMKPSRRTAFVEKHVPVIASDSHDILTRQRMSSDFDAHIVPVWSSARLSPPRKVAHIIQGGQSATFNRVLSAPLRKSSSTTQVRSVSGQTTPTTEGSCSKETVRRFVTREQARSQSHSCMTLIVESTFSL